ncbi:hypothetical protein BJX61DRAFT_516845 [Aspergillus egyptiacus]|nr:hypothetical protein BJX61DRAFT_516845 [Aspergillus egyptiacus]
MSRFTASRSTTIHRRSRPLSMRQLLVYGMLFDHIHITSVGCFSSKPSGDTKYPQHASSGSIVVRERFTNACILLSWQHVPSSASQDI